MRLLPAFILLLIIFVAGLFFLQTRRISHSAGGFSEAPSRQTRKAGLFIATIALIALFGILLLFLGKVAVLIALITLALFFLTRAKGI